MPETLQPDILQIMPITYFDDASAYFQRLAPLGKRVWLDSGKPASQYGRYDILTAAPDTVLLNPNRDTLEQTTVDYKIEVSKDPEIKLPFYGGLIGFFNYEYAHSQYKLKASKPGQTQSAFAAFSWALIQDHEDKKSWLVLHPKCALSLRQKVYSLIKYPNNTLREKKETHFHVKNFIADMQHDVYVAAFEKIHEYILAGDTYQINFSQRFSGEFSGAADAAYLALRKVLPSPFSAFIEISDESILSFSPERFIEVEERLARSQPIKGTIARGENPSDDKLLAEQLRSSEKNRAENVMIVDLIRNDFSQLCEPHSVKVPKLFELESFANVHHLVSTIEGKLPEHVSLWDFFLRCFPGGSITGAPKKRAMEIINELEATPRNIYCGSICYQSAHGRFDSNIAIRTMLVEEDHIYCWGGGGIVVDSTPDAEFNESLQKVNVLMDALTRHS